MNPEWVDAIAAALAAAPPIPQAAIELLRANNCPVQKLAVKS